MAISVTEEEGGDNAPQLVGLLQQYGELLIAHPNDVTENLPSIGSDALASIIRKKMNSTEKTTQGEVASKIL